MIAAMDIAIKLSANEYCRSDFKGGARYCCERVGNSAQRIVTFFCRSTKHRYFVSGYSIAGAQNFTPLFEHCALGQHPTY